LAARRHRNGSGPHRVGVAEGIDIIGFGEDRVAEGAREIPTFRALSMAKMTSLSVPLLVAS